jgi:hypothetical protein
MSCELDRISPPVSLHRLGRVPHPWRWTDWSFAHIDGTFGNRWDDPQSEYRVLYASSHRLACFMETLGRFPADPKVVEGLDAIELEEGEVDHGLAPGELPLRAWLQGRRIATATVEGEFAAVGTSRSLALLHTRVAHLLPEFGLEELDASAIRTGNRALTQRVSAIIFECSTPAGERQFDGIHYLSRYGDEFQNWAIFEPGAIDSDRPEQIEPDDPDLIEAARRLGIKLL